MGCNPRTVFASAAALALAAGGAVSAWHAGQGVALAACALLGAGATLGLRRGVAALAAQAVPLERPVASAPTRRIVELEAQLEFAPVALFAVHGAHARPLNAGARRVLAPGRAADPAVLLGELAQLAGGARRVIDFDTERGCERALATAVALTVEGRSGRLVALMPMESELEAEAMQAWQKLVQVLSHEIMNSLTPVASLTHTARELVDGSILPEDVAADLSLALEAIGRRADSLVRFVGVYRQLACVPEPVLQPVDVAAMLARLEVLVAPEWRARGGQATFVAEPPAMTLLADAGQLEQALVNVLKNAAEATGGVAAPQVTVSARLTRGARLRIEVRDNGPGVPDELASQLFTPFFSTKGQGGGIGLAMVRQLVHRNGGTVRYARSIGAGARFVLAF
jgi:signal transduction histidine kinase